jgi:NitT/TauT family transport system substrate-binding protein
MKKYMVVLTLICTLFVLTSCKKETTEDTIKIGFLPSLTAVPYIYAIEEEIYEDYGIKVEYKPFMKASDRDAALMAGEINAVSTDLVMVLFNNEANLDVKFTVTTEEEFRLVSSPFYTLDENEDISQLIKSTDGATVAISERTVVEYLVDLVASSNDISYEHLSVPAVPSRYAALTKNRQDSGDKADLAIMPEPFPSMVINDDGGKLIWSNVSSNHFPTVLAFKNDFIKAHPEVVKKFHQATDQAISELKDLELDSYKSYIVKYDILDEKYVTKDANGKTLVPMYPYNALYQPKEEIFNSVYKWMQDNQYIENEYQYDDLFYDVFDAK